MEHRRRNFLRIVVFLFATVSYSVQSSKSEIILLPSDMYRYQKNIDVKLKKVLIIALIGTMGDDLYVPHRIRHFAKKRQPAQPLAEGFDGVIGPILAYE